MDVGESGRGPYSTQNLYVQPPTREHFPPVPPLPSEPTSGRGRGTYLDTNGYNLDEGRPEIDTPPRPPLPRGVQDGKYRKLKLVVEIKVRNK